MTGWRLLAGLLALAAAAAVAASTASGQAAFNPPDCAPGTPPIPPPTVGVEGSPASPRVVAGRPFSIEYDSPVGTIVHDTLGPAGTTFDDPIGQSTAPTVPVAGPAAFAVR